MNYIIFGGSFDPLHNGHINIAIRAKEEFKGKIIFVPSKNPRWKNRPIDPSFRLDLIKIAIDNVKELNDSLIDEFEINSRGDINYSIDLILYLKNKYKEDNLYFLIGADQVNQFHNWKEAIKISKLVKIIYVTRPNYQIDDENVIKFNMLPLISIDMDVSSSDIRNLKSLDLLDEELRYIEQNGLYFIEKMKNYLSISRLAHSIEVAKLSYKIARANNINNPENAYIAGLLHDIGKTYKYDELNMKEFINKYYNEYLSLPSFSYHQFLGEYIAKNDFDISDKNILEAIRYHCTGNKDMSILGMIVYSADKIEPTRGFDSSNLISSCLNNYYQGFIDTLIDNKKYLLAHNKDILNPLTDACFKCYID